MTDAEDAPDFRRDRPVLAAPESAYHGMERRAHATIRRGAQIGRRYRIRPSEIGDDRETERADELPVFGPVSAIRRNAGQEADQEIVPRRREAVPATDEGEGGTRGKGMVYFS